MQKIALITLTVLTASFCLGDCPQYDLTGDCWVGLEDLAALASEWMTGSRNTVPYVVGMDQTSAERAIIAAGLTVGEVTLQYSNRYDEGTVIGQEPAGLELRAANEKISIVVSIGLSDFYPDITWLWIDDSGAGMKDMDGEPIDEGGFTGFMSKYETTNAQYCRYLNHVQASVSADGEWAMDYYCLTGPGISSSGATNGGTSRINYNSISHEFTVDIGFENHPVTQVTWYGARAFAAHYGWRLPTEWEWQAVADYDGSYEWGCGSVIHNGIANYRGSYHPVGTTGVGIFGSYGYGVCDMAGNVGEWTSSEYVSRRYTIRDAYWDHLAFYCLVAKRSYADPYVYGYGIGFRVVKD